MTTVENYIGLKRETYNDGDVYPDTQQTIDAARFGGNVQINGTPSADNHAVTKAYMDAWLETLGAFRIAVIDIDDPTNELEEYDSDNSSQMIVAYEGDEFTIYAYDAAATHAVSVPYIVTSKGGKRWVAVGGKYSNLNTCLASAATEDNQGVRFAEFNKRVQIVAVANHLAPTELAAKSGGAIGDILVAYQLVTGGASIVTVYMWQTGSATESAPQIVAGTGGYWVAISGEHVNGQSPMRVVQVTTKADPSAELNLLKGSRQGDLILVYETAVSGQNALSNLATIYMWDTAVSAGESVPWVVDGLSGGYWVAIAGCYVATEFYVHGTMNCESFACTDSTFSGTMQHVKTSQAITGAANTISPVARLVELTGTPVTFTSTPTIDEGVEGQRLTLVSTAYDYAPFVIQNERLLGGSDVVLTGEARGVSHSHPLELVFHDGRWVELNIGIRQLQVVDIADPAELTDHAGAYPGDMIMAYQVIPTLANKATLYMWDDEVTTTNSPFIVAGSAGRWVAVAGYHVSTAMYVDGIFQCEDLDASLSANFQGTFKYTKDTQAIGAAIAQISPAAALVELTGNSVTLTSTPTITAGAEGQRMMIVSSALLATPIVLQDEAQLANTGLRLGALDRELHADSVIEMIYYGGKWHEVSYCAHYVAP